MLLCVGLALGLGGCDRPGEPVRLVAGGDAARGEAAFERYGCGACHEIPGVPEARGRVGPPLTGFGSRGYIAGELPNTPENLVAWVVHPQRVEPGTAMPELGVTPAEARSIAAYLYPLN
jgi:cytochrome c2